MEKLDLQKVYEFVNKRIITFHKSKLNRLTDIDLKSVLKKKNPYLFRAKNINVASDLVKEILDAYLSSSEEKLFGDFLEELAIFIAGITCNGWKSSATGIDLEFFDEEIHYLVSIKSGPNWGNSSQQNRQEEDFKKAIKVLKQSNRNLNIQPVLGICYGKTKDNYLRGYLKAVGQSFWYLISKDRNLYIDIIEPLGHKAKKHNDRFRKEKDKIVNLFTKEFLEKFCSNGQIDWVKLVKYNSGNLLEKKM